MMDGWRKSGNRWNKAEKDRVSRLFRHHVRTPTNPKGRIHRELCHWHSDEIGQAHHVDYSQPFVVVWACESCHRKIDHGELSIPKKAVWDYSSLIAGIAKMKNRREHRRTANEIHFAKYPKAPF